MNIQINSNAFTKLEQMVGISTVNIEILEYSLADKTLTGQVKIIGEYYSGNKDFEENNGLCNFENIIPFEIVFTNGKPLINSVNINDFEYYEIAGRGIEATFNIDVSYDLTDENARSEELIESVTEEKIKIEEEKELTILNDIVNDETNFNILTEEEEIKENITNQIDSILAIKLEVKNDNFLEETPKKRSEKKSWIKVIYYNENEQVKELCKNHDFSYEDVLKENQKYNFSDNHRIIISEKHEYNG